MIDRAAAERARGAAAFGWDGSSWRLPLWMWVGLAAMSVSALHIVIDFGVGLFDLHGTLSLTETTTLLGIAVIQVWWVISFIAGAQGSGGAVASAGVLGAGWAAMTNGFPIVYCPPVCPEARPLTDVGHVGSIVFGVLMLFIAVRTLWRARLLPRLALPSVALLLVLITLVSLANTPIVST